MTKGKSKQHVALIGPVLPFRGGIAQYTTQLHHSLKKYCDLTTISFKRQYPGFLYPGASDLEPDRQGYREPGVDYIIDVYSPLSLRRTTQHIISKGCQVAIFDWWTLFWQPGIAYMARRLRKRGVRVVFLCHNLFDHDTIKFQKGFTKMLLKQADGYIVHAKDQADLLTQFMPKATILQRPHPIYNQYPKPTKTLAKRGKLEVLFFGIIRPYKGLEVLAQALGELASPDIYLTIAGEPWGSVQETKEKLNSFEVPNLELNLRYINDQELANYFTRADVVALPYLSATGSGVVAK